MLTWPVAIVLIGLRVILGQDRLPIDPVHARAGRVRHRLWVHARHVEVARTVQVEPIVTPLDIAQTRGEALLARVDGGLSGELD